MSHRRPSRGAYVATSDLEMTSDIQPLSPTFLESVGRVRAMTVVGTASGPETLAELRGYARADLFAMAEVGYHYLMNGAADVARVIFEGLAAVAPHEAYFTLATGLALDHEGDVDGAMNAYRRAAQLDPADPRPDINRAELYITRRDRSSAHRLLSRAMAKARHKGDMELYRKARALATRVEVMK